MQIKRRTTSFFLIVFVACALSACDYNNLIADSKEFDKLMAAATASLKKTYSGINDYYRKTYISERRFDPSLRVWVRDENRRYSELVYKIDPVEIKARELVLQGLAEYSAGLAAIAGSDAPDKAAELASQLSARLTGTAATLASMKKAPSSGKKPFEIGAYSAPIANLARIASKYWVRGMQTNFLKKSILEGDKTVTSTLDLLESDLNNIFEAAYAENAELTLLAEQNFYNQHYSVKRPEVKPEETSEEFEKRLRDFDEKYQQLQKDKTRIEFLNELSNSAKELAELRTASPLSLIQSMRAAHATIKEYVESDPKSGKLRDKSRGAASSVTGVLRAISGEHAN